MGKLTPRVKRGVWYWPTRDLAVAAAVKHGAPQDRIMEYGLGWAVQWHAGGAYLGPNDQTHPRCSFCPPEPVTAQ